MEDFSSVLGEVLRGKTAFLGIGNTDRGDDGLGVRLAEAIRDAGVENVFIGGTTPENDVTAVEKYDTVVFLDAVLSRGEPGSVVLMEATEIKALFPQVSTHKVSLGTLAGIVSAGRGTKVWLLGVRPVSMGIGTHLSETVKETLSVLSGLIAAAKGKAQERSERESVWS
jgi:hydrogenase maturation protease